MYGYGDTKTHYQATVDLVEVCPDGLEPIAPVHMHNSAARSYSMVCKYNIIR